MSFKRVLYPLLSPSNKILMLELNSIKVIIAACLLQWKWSNWGSGAKLKVVRHLRKPSLWAHFTYRSSFERNYLIVHPILNFLVFIEFSDDFARDLCYSNSFKNDSLLVLKEFNSKIWQKFLCPLVRFLQIWSQIF